MARINRMRFILDMARKTTKYVTRDGRKVVSWRLIADPATSMWPVEVTVRAPHTRATTSYIVNHNGRRYANIRSADDIFESSRKKIDPWPYDCMPSPLEGLRPKRR